MVIYVTHCHNGDEENLQKASRIVHNLQKADKDNCYICPLLTFSAINKGELNEEEMSNIRIDLLSICDMLIVSSREDAQIKHEIDFAKLVGMEIKNLEQQ